MVWVRLDDAFSEHPKIAQLSDSALALWVTSLAYCNRNLTDGFIPAKVGLGQLRYCDGNAVPAVRELEEVGLWDEVAGGWMIHDFGDFQPTKEQVLAEREAARERKAKSRRTSRRDTASDSPSDTAVSSSLPVPGPVPVPDPVTEPLSESTSTSSAARNVENARQAEVLLAEDSTPQHFLRRLVKVNAVWGKVSNGTLMKLSSEYGPAAVIDAMRRIYDAPPELTGENPYPYLEAVCRSIVDQAATA